MNNLDKHIYEGWTVRDFIEDIEPTIDLIMSDKSFVPKPKNKAQLISLIKGQQPYYKKSIKEVNDHFIKKYNVSN